jgi:hypothetical protein
VGKGDTLNFYSAIPVESAKLLSKREKGKEKYFKADNSEEIPETKQRLGVRPTQLTALNQE